MKSEVMTVVQQLSRYLRNHPDACDTSEGIAHWWLNVEPQPVPVAIVETALEWMSMCGLVESSHAADGRIRYRCAGDVEDLYARLDAMSEDPQSQDARAKPIRHGRRH